MTGCASEEKAENEQDKHDNNDLNEYKVEVQANRENAGEIEGGGTYEEGEEVTVEAEPEKGYDFVKWKGDDEKISGETTYQLEAEKNKTLIAYFQPDPDIAVKDKSQDTDWSVNKVIEGAQAAFSTYYSGHPLATKIDKEMDIELEELIKEEDQIKAKASISYPHINRDDFDQLEQKLQDRILSESKQGPVDLLKITGQIIQNEIIDDNDFSKQTRDKTIVMEKDDTFEDRFFVTHYDSKDELFTSFDELYQQAIAHNIDDVVIDISEDKSFKKTEDIGNAKFLGEQIEVKPAIDPDYLLEETTVTISDQTEIKLARNWEELQKEIEHKKMPCPGGTPLMVPYNDPSDYLGRIDVRETTHLDKKATYFKNPGGGSVLFKSAIGFIDLDTSEINIFGMGGIETSDLYWDSSGEYLTYYTQEDRSAITSLHVYDVLEDELIEVSGYEEFKAKYDGDFHGEFKTLTWSEDRKELYFEVKGRDDDKATSWIFNVQEKELRLEQ